MASRSNSDEVDWWNSAWRGPCLYGTESVFPPLSSVELWASMVLVEPGYIGDLVRVCLIRSVLRKWRSMTQVARRAEMESGKLDWDHIVDGTYSLSTLSGPCPVKNTNSPPRLLRYSPITKKPLH